GYLLFRWRYFGQLVPNTFYAKGGPTAETALSLVSLGSDSITRLHELMSSIAKPVGGVLIVPLPALMVVLAIHKHIDLPLAVLMFFVALSGTPFLLLPPDWMSEYRFATAFIVLGTLLIAVLVQRVAALLPSTPRPTRILRIAAAVFAL